MYKTSDFELCVSLIRFMLIIVLSFIVLLPRPSALRPLPSECRPLLPRLVDSFVCVVNIILRLCLCQTRLSPSDSTRALSVISSVGLSFRWVSQPPSHRTSRPSQPHHPHHPHQPPNHPYPSLAFPLPFINCRCFLSVAFSPPLNILLSENACAVKCALTCLPAHQLHPNFPAFPPFTPLLLLLLLLIQLLCPSWARTLGLLCRSHRRHFHFLWSYLCFLFELILFRCLFHFPCGVSPAYPCVSPNPLSSNGVGDWGVVSAIVCVFACVV